METLDKLLSWCGLMLHSAAFPPVFVPSTLIFLIAVFSEDQRPEALSALGLFWLVLGLFWACVVAGDK